MLHNFNKRRFKRVPDQIPKYKVGDMVKIVSTQHYLNGVCGTISEIYPSQHNIFYSLFIDGKETSTIPERMLKLTLK